MTDSDNGNLGKGYSVPAIQRTLDIIETLTRERMLTVSEVNRRFRIPKSSAYAILQTLKARGYVEKDSLDRYSLTLRMFSLGSALMEGLDFRKEIFPLLKEMTEQTQITGHIGVLDGSYIVYVEKSEVLGAVRLTTWIGRRTLVHSTSMGKALLANLSEREVDHILAEGGMPQFTPKTITSPAAFKKELEKVRANGYAVSNEENELGVRAVGAAVFNHSGRPVAAVNLGGSTLHIRSKDIPRLGLIVRTCAERMSAQLGYRPRL